MTPSYATGKHRKVKQTSRAPLIYGRQTDPAEGIKKGLGPVNRPRRLVVQTDDRSRPLTVTFVRDRPNQPPLGPIHQIETIDEVWRIVDEWWRDTPIARTYYRVNLEVGRSLTLFYDEIVDTWFEQRY